MQMADPLRPARSEFLPWGTQRSALPSTRKACVQASAAIVVTCMCERPLQGAHRPLGRTEGG